MPDDPTDTQAQPMPGGRPGGDGPAGIPQDMADGVVKPQDGVMDRPGTEAGHDPGEPMTNEPIPVTEDEPGVGLSEKPEPDIAGSRGM